ncbi:glycoside hydrolase family 15 [Pseudactinotalea sp. Z1739]|uniref:glycoside hydrolase family 15 n=1 Tax=Pseudactinotalea sp. Z1739 TaxID=3413028 RepID=UPI003C79B342
MHRRPLIVLTAVVLAALLTGMALARTDLWDPRRIDEVDPYAWGVQVRPDGERAVILPGAEVSYLRGSRVLAPTPDTSAGQHRDAHERAQADRDWLAAGSVPGTGSAYEEMVTGALLDIRALTLDDGAALAGYNPNWRYVWPRDASFIAAALASAGHARDAVEVLAFLQRVQHPEGTFEARYLPDASGPPDGRGIQTDGTGWVLWATDHVLATLAPDDPLRERIHHDLTPLLARSTAQLLHQAETPDSLPPPSADYWEHPEQDLTLGTAAPVLAGLHAATRIWSGAGDMDLALRTGAAADRLRTAVESTFGPTYPRYPGGTDRDAATAFALPPFQPEPLSEALGAWHDSIAPMRRPAGGLAPGASWREQSLSWTPQTTLYALVAAHNGEPQMALDWLDWVDAHRTPLGAIPEKVSPDGTPAAVAPLAWSAAVVVLTVAQLEDDGVLTPAEQVRDN